MGDDVDPEVDALFDLPADAFVSARDALAKERRAAGDRETAAAVKQLRRPTLSAWALNQLARRHADDVRTLVDQGAALAAAQEQALAGVVVDLREPGRARAETLRRLTRVADAELGGQGGSAHRDEVVATLTAASADPASAALLVQGRLSEPLEAPSGFGGPFCVPSGSAEPAPPRAARKVSRRASAPGDKGEGGDEEPETLDAPPRAKGEVRTAATAPQSSSSDPSSRRTSRWTAGGSPGRATRSALVEPGAGQPEAAEAEAAAAAAAEGKARRSTAAAADSKARRAAATAQEAADVAAHAADAAARRVAVIEDELRRAREVLAEAEQEAGRSRRTAASAAEAAADAAREVAQADSDGASAGLAPR